MMNLSFMFFIVTINAFMHTCMQLIRSKDSIMCLIIFRDKKDQVKDWKFSNSETRLFDLLN